MFKRTETLLGKPGVELVMADLLDLEPPEDATRGDIGIQQFKGYEDIERWWKMVFKV